MEPFFRDIAVDRQFESSTRSETDWIGVVGGVVPGFRADGSSNATQTHHDVKWGNAKIILAYADKNAMQFSIVSSGLT